MGKKIAANLDIAVHFELRFPPQILLVPHLRGLSCAHLGVRGAGCANSTRNPALTGVSDTLSSFLNSLRGFPARLNVHGFRTVATRIQQQMQHTGNPTERKVSMIKKMRALAVVAAALGFLLVPAGDAFAAPCVSGNPAFITSDNYTAYEGTVGHQTAVNTGTRTFGDMTGRVLQNDLLEVRFTLAADCVDFEVSFAAYKTIEPYWNAATADQQRLHDSSTGLFTGTGPHTLKVHAAECYFQVDFVAGPVKLPLGEGGLYGPAKKDWANGGTWQCSNLTGTNDIDPTEEVGEALRPPTGTPERVCFEQPQGVIVCGWVQPF